MKISNASLLSIKMAIEKNKGVVVNDHNVGGEIKVDYIAEFGDEVVLMFYSNHFSVNPIYLDEEGIPHVSTISTGRTLFGRGKGTQQEVMDLGNAEAYFKDRSFGAYYNIAA